MLKKIKPLLSKDRDRAILYSFSASFAARVVGLISTLIITPLLINYFSSEEFGLWSILTIIAGFIGFVDLGLGYGLMNLLSEAKHKSGKDYEKKAIGTTFLFLSITSLILLGLMLGANYFIDWKSFFSISTDKLSAEMSFSMYVVIILFFINIPITIIHKIQFAWLDNHVYHFWEVFQKILLIVLIYFCVYYKAPLYYFAVAFYTPFIVSNLINIGFYIRKKEILIDLIKTPIKKCIDKKIFKIIFNTGLMFLFMSLTYNLGRSSDNFIIGKFSSLETVTTYEIIKKPLDIILVFIMMLSSILWPAFGDAIHAKDFKWIKRVFKKSLVGITLFSILFIGLLLPFGNFILELWLGKQYNLPMVLFLVAGLWYFLLSINNVLSSFLSANNILKYQLYMFIAYIIVGIPLKIIGIKYFDLKGLILINCLSFAVTILIPSFILSKQKIKNYRTSEEL